MLKILQVPLAFFFNPFPCPHGQLSIAKLTSAHDIPRRGDPSDIRSLSTRTLRQEPLVFSIIANGWPSGRAWTRMSARNILQYQESTITSTPGMCESTSGYEMSQYQRRVKCGFFFRSNYSLISQIT